MTFETWWAEHKKGVCICNGTCLWRILQLNESWIDEKAKKRLLSFLRIAPTDEIPPEYVKNAEQTDVSGEGENRKSEVA